MAAVVSPPKSLSHLFQPPSDICQRCDGRVYLLEKVGPVNEVVFHKGCFKCRACDQQLTLKTYFTNQQDPQDKNIYCAKDCPKTTTHGFDARAMGIQSAMKAPSAKHSYNEQIRSGAAPKIGSDALFINQPVSVQNQYQRKYKQQNDQHHFFPAYYHAINKAKEKLESYQKQLEQQQREEEDKLMKNFQEGRMDVQNQMQQEMDQQWEVHLHELTEKFDREMTKKGKKLKAEDQKAMTVKYEQEKDEMKRNMTVKIKKKQEAMTLRLQKKAQEETSDLVSKHSQQMLALLQSKQDEFRQELEVELAQDGTLEDGEGGTIDTAAVLDEAMKAIVPKELPPPHPPRGRKRDLYQDASYFHELDEEVIKVAERDQATFTELVNDLTKHCLTDLHKARAIFRWITVKDLNMMEFDDSVTLDTPLGLLRGIKFGTETYHTLFMRLCSYAGVACVEIKGHSKSVGYEPGMKIREDTFQNTWNAVLIDGDWWPVQCNWGARHLVLNKDQQAKPVKSKKQDKIRYQYDEHYFLTDPDEFIQEFWAQDPTWQLLERVVTLEQFEAMPFVRSVFFHYGLEFDHIMEAVLYTDNKGGAEVKIKVPDDFAKDLVFHYQIRFADRERRNETEFRGAKLERFVFHSLVEGSALFSVHVPTAASYFLEVFANKIDDTNKIGDDPNATMMPFRLKCACKFKIVCEELVGKMHPLPNCASGEWGPSKGQRHFALKPLTHVTGVINVDNDTEIRFRLPRSLHFLCKMRMNGVEDSLLEKYIQHNVHDNTLSVRVRPPQTGQYGLDIYARPEDAADNHTLAHACKYLLNCSRVNDPIELPISKVEPSSKMSKDKWGPSANFDELGLKTLSHREPTIDKSEAGPLVIEIGLVENLKLTYKLIREPDEDCQDKVAMKDNGKKAKFTLTFPKPGNYLFALYARKKKESENLYNVYNYLIRFTPPPPEDSTLNRKKKKVPTATLR